MSKLKDRLGTILIGVGLVVGYILLTDVFHVLSDFLFPSLGVVLSNFPDYIGQLMVCLKSSLFLLVISYVLAVITAIALGTFIGLHSGVRRNVNPWIHALTAIPVPLLTPYAINIFPTFKMASIFLIWLAAFWIILATTIGAVVSIDKRYLENADTLEMPRFEKLFRVVLPAASPAIFTGCSVALTLSFMMLAVAEMFGSDSGLAWFVNYYSDFARYDLVLMGFIFTAVVLVLVMFVFDRIEARALHWTRRD